MLNRIINAQFKQVLSNGVSAQMNEQNNRIWYIRDTNFNKHIKMIIPENYPVAAPTFYRGNGDGRAEKLCLGDVKLIGIYEYLLYIEHNDCSSGIYEADDFSAAFVKML